MKSRDKKYTYLRYATAALFALVSIILVGWTSSLTVGFVQTALPSSYWIVPYLALVIFDGGMLTWLAVYLFLAQGKIQRFVALVMTFWNLLGVGLISAAEILLGGQTLTAAPEMLGTFAIWGLALWTLVNVGAGVVFHLSSPSAKIAAAIQDEKDQVVEDAIDDFQTRREANAMYLSKAMSANLMRVLMAEVGADKDGDGLADLFENPAERGRQSGPRVSHDDVAAYLAANPEVLRLALPVSQNTQTAPHHDAPAAPPQAGQGQPNGPTAKPLGRTGGPEDFR